MTRYWLAKAFLYKRLTVSKQGILFIYLAVLLDDHSRIVSLTRIDNVSWR
ncbi:hypothetical protein [Shewanella holmiensis]|uniref:Uncharacterized protein n=1 Tax=Shewanella holmiensis TaxID=2952222 RepID=A0A9X2WMF6_9GAMM|nr:hypothetical protein [Shewanella holmiensis]MCT7941577.1 hypothetical protein [Shewanella holmiensis]